MCGIKLKNSSALLGRGQNLFSQTRLPHPGRTPKARRNTAEWMKDCNIKIHILKDSRYTFWYATLHSITGTKCTPVYFWFYPWNNLCLTRSWCCYHSAKNKRAYSRNCFHMAAFAIHHSLAWYWMMPHALHLSQSVPTGNTQLHVQGFRSGLSYGNAACVLAPANRHPGAGACRCSG